MLLIDRSHQLFLDGFCSYSLARCVSQNKALLVCVINIIGENYKCTNRCHTWRYTSMRKVLWNERIGKWMILGGTELRNIFNKKGVWCKGQLEAVMQVKIGTRGATHSIHSLIKEFQKIYSRKNKNDLPWQKWPHHFVYLNRWGPVSNTYFSIYTVGAIHHTLGLITIMAPLLLIMRSHDWLMMSRD